MIALDRAREEGRREGLREAAEAVKGFLVDKHTLISDIPSRLRALAGPAQARLDGGEEGAREEGARDRAGEEQARALVVLRAHLEAREKFYREERGVYQRPSPAAQAEAVREIRAALIRHGETGGDRETWRKTSAVFAAGIGIFYSEPHNGTLDRKNHEKWKLHQPIPAGWLPKIYLELWRPWKLQKGKPDPVNVFSELCFERRREVSHG